MTDKFTQRVQALLKKKSNMECFDCGAKGASQAVINIGVFVCQTCGGIHRELQHRVKGVSMSTFKEEETEYLESHGNKKMHAVYFAYFDPNANPTLDKYQGNADKLRTFIKLIYEEQKWHVDNPSNKGKNRIAFPPSNDESGGGSTTATSSSSSSVRSGPPTLLPPSTTTVPSVSSSSATFPVSSGSVDSDPFGFSSPAPAPVTGATNASIPGTATSSSASSSTGSSGIRLNAAPPGATNTRTRPPRANAGNTGTNNSSGANILDSFDQYYGTNTSGNSTNSAPVVAPVPAPVVDPFAFGNSAPVTNTTSKAPSSNTTSTTNWADDFGGGASFGSVTTTTASSDPFGFSAGTANLATNKSSTTGATKRGSVVDILGDLYAASAPTIPVANSTNNNNDPFGSFNTTASTNANGNVFHFGGPTGPVSASSSVNPFNQQSIQNNAFGFGNTVPNHTNNNNALSNSFASMSTVPPPTTTTATNRTSFTDPFGTPSSSSAMTNATMDPFSGMTPVKAYSSGFGLPNTKTTPTTANNDPFGSFSHSLGAELPSVQNTFPTATTTTTANNSGNNFSNFGLPATKPANTSGNDPFGDLGMGFGNSGSSTTNNFDNPQPSFQQSQQRRNSNNTLFNPSSTTAPVVHNNNDPFGSPFPSSHSSTYASHIHPSTQPTISQPNFIFGGGNLSTTNTTTVPKNDPFSSGSFFSPGPVPAPVPAPAPAPVNSAVVNPFDMF